MNGKYSRIIQWNYFPPEYQGSGMSKLRMPQIEITDYQRNYNVYFALYELLLYN